MHDWLRAALEKVPLLHGGVRSVVERCASAGEAFWVYDLPELIAWVALARAAHRGTPLLYAQTLVGELARLAQQPADGLETPTARAAAHWRASAAFSALAALSECSDCFEPLDARRVAKAQEHVFLALQLGEALQGVPFAPLEIAPLPTDLCAALRAAFEPLVGEWASRPADVELRRRLAIATAEQTRRNFGLSRGGLDEDDRDVVPVRRWNDVLEHAGVVEAPDLPVEELLIQMESARDLLLVRASDMAARGKLSELTPLVAAISGLLRPSLDEALEHASGALERVERDGELRALGAAERTLLRAASARALRASLAQAEAAEGPLTASRALSLVRWSADLGERIELWCEAERDDRVFQRVRNVLRSPLEARDTIRPTDL